ncbi:MAG TPA: DUF4340 domain-containing protein [Spirochaetales bacterium]|nr:DUF4340 domain-containing protein [Spirochaetales bacterium]HOV38695.1 DUF4340 domain-containing protein [Spirochaetales bacterium]
MTRKKKLIGAGVLLVLLIIGYFGATAYRKAKIEKQAAAYQSIYMTEIDTKKVVRIELPLKGVILERKEETWTSPAEALGVKLDQEEVNSILWSLCNMRADRIIDENPQDLSVFGLKDAKARVVLTLDDGSRVELLGGDTTPTKNGYYGMKSGDTKVYLLPSYPGERLYVSLTDFRNRKLPSFNADEIEQLVLSYGSTKIAIELKPSEGALEASFTTHILTSPYKVPRGVDGEAFQKLVSKIGDLRIKDFVDDNPVSLTKYGLDKPAIELFVKGKEATLHLLIGKEAQEAGPEWETNRVFAKLKDSPSVFLLEDIRSDLTVKPFDLIDKFAFIINIDKVDKLVIDFRGTRYTGEIKREKTTVTEKDAEGKETQREETKETFYFDGNEVKENTFKDFYQSCIGLLIDAELPSGGKPSGKAEVTLDYYLNDPAGKRVRIQYLPFNQDFYILSREGSQEFLVSKRQLDKVAESIKKITAP